MKNFLSLLLAALLGSALTFTASQKFGSGSTIKNALEVGTPIHTIGNFENNKGETIPLDFGPTSEKVMPAVVHIKSTQERPVNPGNEESNPFRDLFPGGPF